MKILRDLSGDELVKALGKFGYVLMRQTGSHYRLTTMNNGEHHVTVPRHSPLRVGTLTSILSDTAGHFGLTREELVLQLLQ
jgi:predicted RNA binding protein YcfA (HicA-like mRNA interferase family)